jgi:protein SCO1/2
MSMTRALVIITVAAALIATAAMVLFARPVDSGAMALAPDPNMDLLSIPEFEVTTQDGETYTRDELLGQLTILDFFFTHCPFICPPMSQNMLRAQRALANTDVQFLSISVDPEHDTPERLKEYAREIGADTSTWTFTTTDRETVNRILRDGLLLASSQPNPEQVINLPSGTTMSNITHPSHFILVGPDGDILSLTNGLNRAEVDVLIDRARQASTALTSRR